MSYEEAFHALNSGDYHRAAVLLERAAEHTAYASDMINHAYTLALYRAGDMARLANVAFRVGSSLVAADPASAMDYFQRAANAGLDSGRTRQIGEIFEEWAGERRPGKPAGPIQRIGHVAGSLIAAQPPAAYIQMLTRLLKEHGVESEVFTTESKASWFFNPEPVARSESAAKDRVEGTVRVASIEGDFFERAERVAETIRDSGIQLLFYHGNLSDQITARVAALQPAPVQIGVNYDVEMDADLFDGFVHLRQNGLERTRFKSHPAAWIPPGSNLDPHSAPCDVELRQSLGIDADTVSSSFAVSSHAQGPGFVKALSEVMRRFPRHFHLFGGAFDVRSIRGLLHSEGILPRIRFLGPTMDMGQLTRAVDVCLAPFPDPGAPTVLEMMDAGRPVVTLRHAADSEFNTAAELVGEAELTPGNAIGYIQVAGRLIGDSVLRARLGQSLCDRVAREFSAKRMVERFTAFVEKLR